MADGSSKRHGCKKRSIETRPILFFSGPIAKIRSIPSSELVHGWTEEWVKYLDYISKIDIGHDAPCRQGLRYESTVYMRSFESNKQAGPLCQRLDYHWSEDTLVSLQRAQGKGVPHIPLHLRTRQNHTLDPANNIQNGWVSTGRRIFSSSSSLTWTGSPTWWSSSSLDHQCKNGTLKGGKTKNGGISDNNNNARGTRRLVQGDLYGEVRAKWSQLLSSSPESGLHLQSCALLRFFVPSGSYASSGNCHERDGEVYR